LEQLGTDLSGLKDLLLHNRGASEDREEGPEPAAPAAGPAEVDPGESQEVNRRLGRLERRLGRVKTWGALAAALVLVAVAGLGFSLNRGPEPGGSLTAPALTIHDPQGGACRAWLGLRDGGLCLDLLDRDGKIRSTWGLDKDGDPSLQFYDRDHKLRAELALGAQGDPGLSLVDQAGRLRVALGGIGPGYQVPPDILERPLSSLVLFNQDGVPVWRAPLRWHR
jgi:hypothetical protein